MNREPLPDVRKPDFGWSTPPFRESQHDMVEYLTEVTRDMKRMMDEHTIELKKLVVVLTSMRDMQVQEQRMRQRYGK